MKLNDLLMLIRADREQWKLDFKAVHGKEQEQQRIITGDQNAGIPNRQELDNHLGALIHPPGIDRDMHIGSINARVQSQSGRAIAIQREVGIIPQSLPAAQEARIPSRTARIPAVVSPHPGIIGNDQQLRQLPDDPFLAAILKLSEAQMNQSSTPSPIAAPNAPSQASLNRKIDQEARAVEIRNLMEQHKFVQTLPDDFPNKVRLLETIALKVIATNIVDKCPICLEGFESEHKNTARLPCCTQYIHTACMFRIPVNREGERSCPLCREQL